MKPIRRSAPRAGRIPVVEEQATVAKQVEETGAVRVRVESDEVDESLDLESTRGEVDVQRVAVNVMVDERRAPWVEDGVIVVPIYEEVLVRRLMLKEEIRLVPRRCTEPVKRTVSLRRERAVIERRQADGSWRPVAPVEAGRQTGSMGDERRETEEPEFDVPSRDRSTP